MLWCIVRQSSRHAEMRPSSLYASIYLLLRTIGGAWCVLTNGNALRATAGVLHGPLTTRLWGSAAFLIVVLISMLFRGTFIRSYLLIAYLSALSAILCHSAALPFGAAICLAIATGAQTNVQTTYAQLSMATLFLAILSGSDKISIPDANLRVIQALLLGAAALDVVQLFPANEGRGESNGGKRRRKAVRRKQSLGMMYSTVMQGAIIFFCTFMLGCSFVPQIGAAIARTLYPRSMPRGYTVLAFAKGPTGRISVIEERKRGVRFLISDHSILGGAYINPGYERETVFSQFHVHEAVRLSRRSGELVSETAGGREGRTLCLGLGIGVVAQAIHELGSDVTAVEIDPVVARYATQYFGVRGPSVHVVDATEYLRYASGRVRKGEMDPFEYIVHDVFTGGAVPLSMFSVDTFRMIHDVMADGGILAVNFVGALNDPNDDTTRAVAAVWTRLANVFQFVTAFAENSDSEIHNVVFFASDVEERMTFRKPVPRDYLESTIRQDALESFEKRRIDENVVPKIGIEHATDKQINAGQWITAREHWLSMRKILDRSVWYALAAMESRGR